MLGMKWIEPLVFFKEFRKPCVQMDGQTDRQWGEPFGGSGYNKRAPILCYFGHNNNNYDDSDNDSDSDSDYDNDNGNGNSNDDDDDNDNDNDAAAAAAADADDDDDNNNKLWTQFRSHW